MGRNFWALLPIEGSLNFTVADVKLANSCSGSASGELLETVTGTQIEQLLTEMNLSPTVTKDSGGDP
ncbi:MAG: hypothetical protein BWK78_08085 [Thiotrichaceae bacterium IS1]|nr:MAG: hypothetical protein BWK78_08085 [Thiotrichaceae bacterium IS1]